MPQMWGTWIDARAVRGRSHAGGEGECRHLRPAWQNSRQEKADGVRGMRSGAAEGIVGRFDVLGVRLAAGAPLLFFISF